MGERNFQWATSEISPEMREDVEKQMNIFLESKPNEYKEMEASQHLKDFFDKKYSPNWHCVVGKHFASFVTYTSKHYVFFYIGQMAFLLYKL